MILEFTNPISNEVGKMKELTIEDFRSIAFMVENDSDESLHTFLNDRIIGNVNAQTKLLLLIQARMKFVSEQIIFNNGTSNVTIDLNYLWKELVSKIEPAKKILTFDTFDIEIDYPSNLLHSSPEDLLYDCVKDVKAHHNGFDYNDLSVEHKKEVISKLNAKIVNVVLAAINEVNNPITIFEARANIPDIVVGLFDNSSFTFIRALFSYYNYEEITELLFMLSKRIPDIQYLCSRTPRDLELLIRLYTEEIEKSNSDTKSL